MKSHPHNTAALHILQRLLTIESDFINAETESLEGIASVFHPDVILHEPASLPYAGDWNGHNGITRLFKLMRDTWAYLNGENLQAVLDGDTLYMCCTMAGCLKGTGQVIRQPFAQVIRLKDGLIIECTPFYFDTKKIADLMGTQ